MTEIVHIVALAARTPVGLTAETSAAAVRAGISRIEVHPFMADHNNENVCGAIDRRIDPGITGWQRLPLLAGGAFDELFGKLGTTSVARHVPLLLALPELRPGFEEEHAHRTLDQFAAHISGAKIVQLKAWSHGHAGGLDAIAEATRRIREGRDELCLAGGVDSYFDFDTIDWLEENRQLMRTDIASGFSPGEAAGFVALAGERMRRRLGLPSLGVVAGFGVAEEKKLIKTEAIHLGEGLGQAIREALSGVHLPDEAADVVYCDINGERYRSEEWCFAVLRVPDAARTMDYTAPADCWGDVGAASGPLLCTLAARAWARGYAPGPRALVWASSEAGLRTAVYLTHPATP